MSDFQKRLDEMKKRQESEQLLAMADFTAFVQKNYPDAKGTPSGLFYVIEQAGSGEKPNKMQNVSVHYTGYFTDGRIFDSSHKRNQPFSFPLGAGRVIKGWDEGVALLSVGAKCKLIIPYFLAYGENGRPPVIPPKATLVFDVELLGFN